MVTHYHADHTNGLYEVLRRVPVDKLYLPDIEDEYGVRERLTALAEEKDVQVVWVTDTVTCPLGQAVLTVYPPVQCRMWRCWWSATTAPGTAATYGF